MHNPNAHDNNIAIPNHTRIKVSGEQWLRNGFRLSLALASVLIARGLLISPQWNASRPLQVDATEKSFGRIVAGQVVPVRFVFLNRGASPISILGTTGACWRFGCVRSEGFPIKIPAGERREVVFLVDARAPGRLEADLEVFSTCSVRRVTTVWIKGEIVAAPIGS